MKNPITLLPPSDFKVLKVFAVNGPIWNKFSGFIFYKRQLTKEYNQETPDFVDLIIFETIKISYPDARLCTSKYILFEGEYEDSVLHCTGGSSINFDINIIPSIPAEEYPYIGFANFSVPAYVLRLKFNLYLHSNSDKIENIIKTEIAYVDYKKYDELGTIYKTFDFNY